MAIKEQTVTQEQTETLKRQYQLRFAEIGEYRNQIWQILCSQFFSRYIPENSKVLDLGSGWGEFINNIAAVEKYAIDLNPESADHLSDGVICIHQDCSQTWAFESDYLDVVFTSNFLEHLQDKSSVERTISEAHRCLKYGGLLICLNPNVKFIPGAYWDFWDHQIPLTELSCAEVLRMKGFSIKQCIPRFLPYSMSAGSRPPLFLVKLYLKLPILWPLFGKQFVLIGRKEVQAAVAGGK